MKKSHGMLSLVIVAVMVLAVFPAGSVLAKAAPAGPVVSSVILAPNPALLADTVTVSAHVDDSTAANVVLLSAEFSVNGGAWAALVASDGSFDAFTEEVTGSFSASSIGTYDVCVRATDVLNNTGKAACAPLTVQSGFTFTGFKTPIKMGKVNKGNAPQAIPLKWTLTLTTDGTPVADPASFVAVESYALDCTTLTGDISTAVVEAAAGKTGLKYKGSGKWAFNWKTPKTYRHTCRSMFVLFSDGAMSPQVVFRFK
jgi:hypothetical protein